MVERLIAELAGGRELIAQAEALEQFAEQIDVDPDAVTSRMLSIAMKQTARTYRMNAQAEQPANDWQHLKAFGYAPGSYMNECQACKTIVHDLDKRAITCRPCAEKAFAAAMQPAEQGVPVAHGFAPNGDGKITDALVVGHNDDPEYNIPLYRIPDPRIAALEALLREVLEIGVNDYQLIERIEAALGGSK